MWQREGLNVAKIEVIRDARCRAFTFQSETTLCYKGCCRSEELHEVTVPDNMLREWVDTFEKLKDVYPLRKRG